MTRRFFGLFGVLTGLSLVNAGCIDDPLADLDGAAAAVVMDYELLVQAIGEADTVIARVVDGRFTALEVPTTYTACDADVAVSTNASHNPVPPVSVSFVVQALASGASCVIVSGGGVTDTLDVGVLPVAFGGTISPTTPLGGDTVTINSTAELKFDTAGVTVQFGGGAFGTVVSNTPDQVKVLAPFSTAGPLVINGINVTYVPDLVVSLSTTTSVTQTGNRWAAASSWQTAPDISSSIPADSGASSGLIVTRGAPNVAVCPELPFASAGPCMMFRFTVAATTPLTFSTDWEGTAGDPDIDIYVCADTVVADFGTANDPCYVSGTSGATGAKPQSTGSDPYPAGTYWLVLEVYAGTGPGNAFVTITRP